MSEDINDLFGRDGADESDGSDGADEDSADVAQDDPVADESADEGGSREDPSSLFSETSGESDDDPFGRGSTATADDDSPGADLFSDPDDAGSGDSTTAPRDSGGDEVDPFDSSAVDSSLSGADDRPATDDPSGRPSAEGAGSAAGSAAGDDAGETDDGGGAAIFSEPDPEATETAEETASTSSARETDAGAPETSSDPTETDSPGDGAPAGSTSSTDPAPDAEPDPAPDADADESGGAAVFGGDESTASAGAGPDESGADPAASTAEAGVQSSAEPEAGAAEPATEDGGGTDGDAPGTVDDGRPESSAEAEPSGPTTTPDEPEAAPDAAEEPTGSASTTSTEPADGSASTEAAEPDAGGAGAGSDGRAGAMDSTSSDPTPSSSAAPGDGGTATEPAAETQDPSAEGSGGFVTATPSEDESLSSTPEVDEEVASETISEDGRLPTGIDVFDDAMGGGVPPGRLVVLVADPGVQSELIVDSLLTQRDTLFVTTDRPDWEVQKDIEPGIGSGEIQVEEHNPDSLLSGVDTVLDEIGTTSNFVLDSVNELELVSRGRYRIFLSDVKKRLFETGSIGLLTGVTVDHESARDLTLRRADIVWRIETRPADGELEHWFSVPKFRGGAALSETIKLHLTDEVSVDPEWDGG